MTLKSVLGLRSGFSKKSSAFKRHLLHFDVSFSGRTVPGHSRLRAEAQGAQARVWLIEYWYMYRCMSMNMLLFLRIYECIRKVQLLGQQRESGRMLEEGEKETRI